MPASQSGRGRRCQKHLGQLAAEEEEELLLLLLLLLLPPLPTQPCMRAQALQSGASSAGSSTEGPGRVMQLLA